MGLETAIAAALIAGGLGAVGGITSSIITATNKPKAPKVAPATGPTKQQQKEATAQQRRKEHAQALSGSQLLGGNQNVLGGEDTSATSRSTLLGN